MIYIISRGKKNTSPRKQRSKKTESKKIKSKKIKKHTSRTSTGRNEQETEHASASQARHRGQSESVRIARARYVGNEFLSRRSGTDGFVAHSPSRGAVPSYRAASRPAGRARRRPSRRMRPACRPPHAGAAPARPVRPRRAVDRISSGVSRIGARGLRRVRHSRDVDPQGRSGLA